MNISLNWLNELIPLEETVEEIGEMLTSLGLEVEGLEEYESVKGSLEGVVVGHVVKCGKHPNADKLSLTRVDLGDDIVQIVCGAPNVAEGQRVLVATVGTSLYDEDGNPWKIKKTKIRGEESFGMICAEDELGLGTSHDGILVLHGDYKPGTPAHQIIEVIQDKIFEIGLTPNRSDATHHLGVARDLAAALKVRKGKNVAISEPVRMDLKVEGKHPSVSVELISPEACPRYSGIVLENIEVGESPEWLKSRLESIGVRPINNVVDSTNLVLHEMGQPLHAFDLERIQDKKIIVDFLPEGTAFLSLDEVERKLNKEDLMICDGKRNPMCIGGVFGGMGSGVTDETTSIFLESAHFHPTFIRRSSTRHLLRTDAAKVFEKGSDPSITIKALERAAYLICELAGARVSGPAIDLYPNPVPVTKIDISLDYINTLSGGQFSVDDVVRIFESMKMGVEVKGKDEFVVEVTPDKCDVIRPADLVEEILRVYGYDTIEPGKKLSTTLIPSSYPDSYRLRNLAADTLKSLGFQQMMNLSLTQSAFYPESVKNQLVYILNTSNSHLDIMRPDMVVPCLETMAYNFNRRAKDLKFFEFGHSYTKTVEGFEEKEQLLIAVSGDARSQNWVAKPEKADFYFLKGIVQNLLVQMGVVEVTFAPSKDKSGMSFDLIYRNTGIGKLLTPSKELYDQMGVEEEVWLAVLDWDTICKMARNLSIEFMGISKFPDVRRDLALLVDQGVNYGELKKEIFEKGGKKLREVDLFDVYENEEQLGKGKKSYALSLIFEDMEKTMTDKEIEGYTSRIVKNLKQKFDLSVR